MRPFGGLKPRSSASSTFANRLAKRDLPHNKQFAMCSFVPEDCSHLFAGCTVTNIIWNSILQWANLQAFVPTMDQGLVSWWISAREAYHGKDRKRLDCRGRKECLCFLKYFIVICAITWYYNLHKPHSYIK